MAGNENAVMRSKKQSFELRPAIPDDLNFAWRLYRDSMKPLTEELMTWKEEKQHAVIEAEISSGQASIIVVGGVSVGWMLVREQADEIELCQLYIEPSRQNRGIGSEIITGLMREARENSKPLTLQVVKINRAYALYERLGFIQTGASEYKRHMTWKAD